MRGKGNSGHGEAESCVNRASHHAVWNFRSLDTLSEDLRSLSDRFHLSVNPHMHVGAGLYAVVRSYVKVANWCYLCQGSELVLVVLGGESRSGAAPMRDDGAATAATDWAWCVAAVARAHLRAARCGK
jgi:hypothetical protein